jgi:LmbE family N-acetylglucosaminyl deacetylase
MTTPQTPQLPHLDESDMQRVLCVVAHPDDMEYGAAAAVARWSAAGIEVRYTLVTSGEAGIDGLSPGQAGPLREQEERDGAALVGVHDVEFLGHRDGVVEYGLPLRRDLARAIRRHRPDTIVSMTPRERFAGGGTNQADHRAVGLAALDASKDAGNRWIFTELTDEHHEPWTGVRRVMYAGSPEPTHGVDVTGFVDAAVASLRAHAAYLEGLSGDFPPPEDFLPMMAAGGGLALGVDAAVLFEVFDL